LSIHSITTQRREAYHWAAVFATSALGTALWRAGSWNGIAAFWMSCIVTRPLGASFADYISRPKNIGGIDFGDGPTAIVFAVAAAPSSSWSPTSSSPARTSRSHSKPLAAPGRRAALCRLEPGNLGSQ
jgi:uncharacterized membrane-anchored protein